MIKLSFLVTRRPDLTRAEFEEYWTEKHTPLVTSLPETGTLIRRYVQLHLVDGPDGLPAAPYDGVAEVWVDDMDAVLQLFGSENFTTVVAEDENRFLDREKTVVLIAEETAVFGG
jgi:uncharacterized protein (TIGR02118 family)